MMKIDAVKMENLMMKRGKTVDDLDRELRRSKGFTRDVLKKGEVGKSSLGYVAEILGVSENDLRLGETPEQMPLPFVSENDKLDEIIRRLERIEAKLEVTG